MGTVFKKQSTRPIPTDADITEVKGMTIARWRVRGKLRTAKVTTGADGSPRIVTESATWFAKYRDAAGVVVVRATGCRDQQAARQKLADWMREQELIDSGILDAGKLDLAEKSGQSLDCILMDYEANMRAEGVTDSHRKEMIRCVWRVVNECEFETLRDLNQTPVVNWLARQVKAGMGARTRNQYRNALATFGNWCKRKAKCLAENPFAELPKADERADPRRPSRALTQDELHKLLQVACERPLKDAMMVRRGKHKGELSANLRDEVRERLVAEGRERAMIYKTLVMTGLRKNELTSITVGQFHHEAGKSFLTLKPQDEKNGQGNRIELTDELADELREHSKGLPTSARLLNVPMGLLRILDRDLKAAGIPKVDDRGLCVHVHAMRKTTCTMLNVAGVPVRVAQKIMRHSRPELTMNVYTDEGQLDVRAALDRMPNVKMPNSVAPPVAPARCNGGHFESSQGTSERVFEYSGEVARIDVTSYPVNKKGPLTSGDISGPVIGLAGFEPTTSCTPIETSGVQPSGKQGTIDGTHAPLHHRLHLPAVTPSTNSPSSPLDLARLLAELATLPAEQRAAIATLLGGPAKVPPRNLMPIADDRLPWEKAEDEGG